MATAWDAAKAIIGTERVLLGPQASAQWLHAPDHLAMVLARYRAAAALIGNAERVIELGCGEGIGAGVLAKGRRDYLGYDTDDEAIQLARGAHRPQGHRIRFGVDDITVSDPAVLRTGYTDAVVAIDVIEHLTSDQVEQMFCKQRSGMTATCVCVIGTPNAAFNHLASPQSQAGHINTYTHERLHALMSRYFRVVQSFGMQDASLHLGHPEARHYLLMAGIGPR
jgi:2-polyprenyl-3-methyl-5-hydroxy-6-metoxy-1,4-benzoquinol methylase